MATLMGDDQSSASGVVRMREAACVATGRDIKVDRGRPTIIPIDLKRWKSAVGVTIKVYCAGC
jgi:hypothetical protein